MRAEASENSFGVIPAAVYGILQAAIVIHGMLHFPPWEYELYWTTAIVGPLSLLGLLRLTAGLFAAYAVIGLWISRRRSGIACVAILAVGLEAFYSIVIGGAAEGRGAARRLPVLIQELADADPGRRRWAAWEMGSFYGARAAPALPALIRAVDDPDPEVRKSALRGIEAIGPEAREAVPALRGALGDRDGGVRAAAGCTLAGLGHPSPNALADLVERFESENVEEQWVTLRTMGRMGRVAPEALPHLLQALHDRRGSVRGEAALALGDAKARPALADLRRLAGQDREAHVRRAARVALARIGP
ncbi:MAG TPA: HEAT repeat domain-containing protein [Planctomycetota bacterium]|nr:HEAT repeat domain-containing protein [Planctomycetota bacterium]